MGKTLYGSSIGGEELARGYADRGKRIKELEDESTYHGTVIRNKNEYIEELEAERDNAFNAGLEAAAQVAGRMAEMMESGAGETEPGERLRQVERMIRALKEES